VTPPRVIDKKGDDIPDGEILFRYVKPPALPNGQTMIPLGLFKDPDLSCDWSKYQKSPQRSQHVVNYGRTVIIKITVCPDIRNPKDNQGKIITALVQKIRYMPSQKNTAHSTINGEKELVVRRAIADNAEFYQP